MPRPNPPRTLAHEEHLAERVAFERERAGMTYDGLAKRMTDHGCPIQASALYKIEKGSPRRRITVDELVAFSLVFGVQMAELLTPPDLIEAQALASLANIWAQAALAAQVAAADAEEAEAALASYVAEHPDLEPALDKYLGDLFAEAWGDDVRGPAALRGWQAHLQRAVDNYRWQPESEGGAGN